MHGSCIGEWVSKFPWFALTTLENIYLCLVIINSKKLYLRCAMYDKLVALTDPFPEISHSDNE